MKGGVGFCTPVHIGLIMNWCQAYFFKDPDLDLIFNRYNLIKIKTKLRLIFVIFFLTFLTNTPFFCTTIANFATIYSFNIGFVSAGQDSTGQKSPDPRPCIVVIPVESALGND